ncbi:G-protein gamma subunit [Cyathus striatus]|nr:G-protein gamma subunit [Cyathus striatus]
MSELKLRRMLERNQQVREELARPRLLISEASESLIRYCQDTKDYFALSVREAGGKHENPFTDVPQQAGCNCVIM